MKIILLFISLVTATCMAQRPQVVADYINQYRQLAIAEQIRTGIPAAITLAQGIHESGAGMGELALRSNNHFGIKCKSDWTGDKVYHDDDATGECFRAYNSVADSYRDHSDFLKAGKRYSFLFNLNIEDYNAWAQGLKQAGYATNPRYSQVLVKIIEENGLNELTLAAIEEGSDGNVWTEVVQKTTEQPAPPARKEAVVPDAATQAIFKINHCKVVFVQAGTSLRAVAGQYGLALDKLLEYNDLQRTEKLNDNQLIFLEKKGKKGHNKIHGVKKGETAWSISQQEGIRLERLLGYNRLKPGVKLKIGQRLYLRTNAPK